MKMLLFHIFVVVLLLTSCGPMDETYKDYIKDGPIMYLTRVSKDSLIVRNGWERIQIDFPVVTDGRSSYVVLVLNGIDTFKYELLKKDRTRILLENMKEGSIIFSTWLEDDKQHKSLPTDFTGTVYGEQYKSYLLNRAIASKTLSSGNLIVNYAMLLDSTMVASKFTWDKNGIETTKVFYYNENAIDTLNDFSGNGFKMATLYVPDNYALDSIWSEEKVISR